MKKKLFYGSFLLAIVYILVTLIVPDIVEKDLNKITQQPPYNVSGSAQALYDSLSFIGDLHSDALLWNRNLTRQSDIGHVDFPRLQQSSVTLQAFTIVSKSPAGQNFESNSSEAFDNITLLNIVQGRPVSNWFSLVNRALYQIKKLHLFAEVYEDDFVLVKSRIDLEKLIKLKKTNPSVIGGFIGIEGAHAIEGSLENLDRVFEAGVRMMGPTHFFDNKLGGSAHGISGEGLTPFGEQVIDRMNELGMLVDLSHISPNMIDDILARTTKPVIVSHTGVRAIYNSQRNLSDAHIKSIAANKGLIGIAFFPGAIGDGGIPAIVASMKHVRDLVGIEFVALGSDFDGSVTTPFDVTGLPLLVDELLKQGFTRDEIKAIMGENMRDFLLKNLP
tara:strand:- start:20472 stop:21638 length:1167 start_codon:yes stop_codon:yes gene_type:complete